MLELRLPALLPRLSDTRSYSHDEEPSPFARGPKERPLRLLVDEPSLPSGAALDTLRDLRGHPLVDITSTDPSAPPPRLTIAPRAPGLDYIPFRIDHPDGGWTESHIWNSSRWLDIARTQHAVQGGDMSGVERRILVARAAESRFDGLVTVGEPLDAMITDRSNPVTLAQAAALLGLFLRSRDDAIVSEGRAGFSTALGVGTQRFAVTRYTMFEGWRWFSACVHSSIDRLSRLGEGVQVRFERALRARDEVMIECLSREGQGRTLEREILYHFDAMLLWLGGALDTTAVVANQAHEVRMPDHTVGWRSRRWRAALAGAAPQLHSMTEPDMPARAVIDLIATFRNTIHGQPVSGVAYTNYRTGHHMEELVALPVDAEEVAIEATHRLGGPPVWGFVTSGAGGVGGLWDPYRFVQVVLPFAAATLNALMAATEVERLPGVRSDQLLLGPPADWGYEKYAARLLCLHGFAF